VIGFASVSKADADNFCQGDVPPSMVSMVYGVLLSGKIPEQHSQGTGNVPHAKIEAQLPGKFLQQVRGGAELLTAQMGAEISAAASGSSQQGLCRQFPGVFQEFLQLLTLDLSGLQGG